jgi:hypothetical protein
VRRPTSILIFYIVNVTTWTSSTTPASLLSDRNGLFKNDLH